jgi:hypothetical protein
MAEHRRRRRRGHTGFERRSGRPHPLFLALTAAATAAIAFWTLCPLSLRPHMASPDLERFAAYFILGVAAALAAPRRVTLVSISLVALAFGLEAAQRLAPGRDGLVGDAVVKGFGALLGAQCGVMTFAARRWLSRTWPGYRGSRLSRRAAGRLQTGLRPSGVRP